MQDPGAPSEFRNFVVDVFFCLNPKEQKKKERENTALVVHPRHTLSITARWARPRIYFPSHTVALSSSFANANK